MFGLDSAIAGSFGIDDHCCMGRFWVSAFRAVGFVLHAAQMTTQLIVSRAPWHAEFDIEA